MNETKDIQAGVTLITKFCRSGSTKFTGYINYIDRDEATRTEHTAEFNLYQEYMGNPEKTSSLYTDELDTLSAEQKEELKEVFSSAQKNGSLMWQTVISFDNRWLAKNHIYDADTGQIDEAVLQAVTRSAMRQLQKSEHLENAVWSAAIHFNTDNVHIHVAMVEPVPMRQKILSGPYAGEYRGVIKEKTLELAKSRVVNEIIGKQPENERINELIRDQFIRTFKENRTPEEKLEADLQKVYEKIKPVTNLKYWTYGSQEMKDVRPLLDQITKNYLEQEHPEEWKEFQALLKTQDEKYRTAYGKNSRRSYEQGKLDDLYKRMGNAILSTLRDYERSQRRKSVEERRRLATESRKKVLEKSHRKRQRHLAGRDLKRAAWDLKRSFEKEWRHIKNQIAYEQRQEQDFYEESVMQEEWNHV